jgi:hypothetical protein
MKEKNRTAESLKVSKKMKDGKLYEKIVHGVRRFKISAVLEGKHIISSFFGGGGGVGVGMVFRQKHI